MLDFPSVIFGIVIVIVIILMYYFVEDLKSRTPDYPQIDPRIANDLVGELPYCPECNSYDIELIDLTNGVSWLKGHIQEKDFYCCKKCGREFSDEDWLSSVKLR